jgi:hypothetical protein
MRTNGLHSSTVTGANQASAALVYAVGGVQFNTVLASEMVSSQVMPAPTGMPLAMRGLILI